MDFVSAVVADEQSFEVMEPGEGALNDPAVSAEPGAVFGLASGDLGFDPEFSHEPAVFVVVVAAVGGDPSGSLAWAADLAADGRDALDQGDQLGDVVAVATGDRPGQRDPGRVD